MTASEDLEKLIIDVAIKISRRGEGAILILGDNLEDYQYLVNQDVKPFNIVENPKLIESLALMDGAVWIDNNGIMKGYGLSMTKIDPLINKGTRHAAAMHASKWNKVFLVSQEDKKVKILLNGQMIMQIDTLEKDVEKHTSQAVNLLESVGAGAGATILAGMAFPAAGVAIIPGILIFGSAHMIIKALAEKKIN